MTDKQQLPADVVERILVSRHLYIVHSETYAHTQTERKCLGVYGRFEDAKRTVVDTMLVDDLLDFEYYDPAKRYGLAEVWGRENWIDRWSDSSSGVANYTVETWAQNVRDGMRSSRVYAFDGFFKTKVVHDAMTSAQARGYLCRIRERNEGDVLFRELLSDALFVPEPEPWRRRDGQEFDDERVEWRRTHGHISAKRPIDWL